MYLHRLRHASLEVRQTWEPTLREYRLYGVMSRISGLLHDLYVTACIPETHTIFFESREEDLRNHWEHAGGLTSNDVLLFGVKTHERP